LSRFAGRILSAMACCVLAGCTESREFASSQAFNSAPINLTNGWIAEVRGTSRLPVCLATRTLSQNLALIIIYNGEHNSVTNNFSKQIAILLGADGVSRVGSSNLSIDFGNRNTSFRLENTINNFYVTRASAGSSAVYVTRYTDSSLIRTHMIGASVAVVSLHREGGGSKAVFQRFPLPGLAEVDRVMRACLRDPVNQAAWRLTPVSRRALASPSGSVSREAHPSVPSIGSELGDAAAPAIVSPPPAAAVVGTPVSAPPPASAAGSAAPSISTSSGSAGTPHWVAPPPTAVGNVPTPVATTGAGVGVSGTAALTPAAGSSPPRPDAPGGLAPRTEDAGAAWLAPPLARPSQQ
jgi:hypothetical protein